MADDVRQRAVQRALARRGETYVQEVQRLLDAGLAVMVRRGSASLPRVADIVAEAGLSNDAFYRYFPSKGALVEALLEVGAEQLRTYLAHQMAKERDPARQVRSWVDGIFMQCQAEVAATTRAVLWNASTADSGAALGRHFATGSLATLLHEPFAELGSADAELDATLVAHATLGTLADHVWAGTTPTAQERDRIVAFCLAATGARVPEGDQGAA
jgi:AcrR family transcriptional regulator